MKKILSILLITLSLLALITIFGLFVLARVQNKSAHQEFVSIISQTLGDDITFQDFSISYLRSFPKISIRVKEVAMQHQTHETQKVGELEIRMNLIDFWRNDEIRLTDLIIRNGSFVSTVDSLGNKTRLFNEKKPDTANAKNEAIALEIKNIKIYDCQLQFGNEIKHNRVKLLLNHAHFSLNSQDSLLLLKGELSGHLDSLISNNSTLIANHPFTGEELNFTINQLNGVKELTGGHLDLHTLRLKPRFHMKPHLDGQMIEVHIDGGDSFNNLMGLVEFHSDLAVEQINPDATLRISFNQSGFVNPFLKPYSELDFEIMSAEFTGEKLPCNIKVGKIKGNYNNGEAHAAQTSELVIDTLYTFIDKSYIHGNLKLTNLNDPVIHSHLIASLDLTHLIPQTENITVAGTVEANLQIDGKISELRDLHTKGEKKATGSVNVQNLRLLIKDQGYDLNFVNGSGILDNHLLEVTRFVGAFNESAFHFQGKFENLDEYIIEKEKDLDGKFVLNFDYLDLRKLYSQNNQRTKQGNTKNILPYEGMSLDFEIQGKSIITDFGDFNDIDINSHFQNNILNIHSFALSYQEGSIGGFGEIWLNDGGIDSIMATLDGKFKAFEFQLPESNKGNRQKKPINIPEFIHANIQLNILQGEVEDIEFKDFCLNSNIHGKQFIVDKLKFEAYEGTTDLTGRLFFDEAGINELMLRGDLSFDQIDMEQLMGKNFNNQEVKKKNSPNIPKSLDLDLNISANQILYGDFSAHNISTQILAKNTNKEKRNTDAPPFFAMDELKLDFKASNLLFKKASMDDINLSIVYANNLLELNQLNFDFAGSKVYLNGYLNGEKNASYPGYIFTTIDTLDIQRLFAAFDNFNQTTFTSQNTSGQISLSAHYYLRLDQNFKLSSKDNLLIANNRIHSAELDKVEPIENALFFVGHKAKDKMIINELDVNLIMVGNEIYFNDLFMNDNIANLDAFGKVNLENNMMEVGIEVSLTDLFFRTKKERVAETKEGIVKLDSDAKLFLDVNGMINDNKLKLISRKKFDNGRKNLMEETKSATKIFQQTHDQARQKK